MGHCRSIPRVSHEPDHAGLIASARAGDQDAWDGIVQRHSARVWAVARAYGLSKADADDVYQLTWYRLLTHLDSVRDPEKLGAWLATTARHESLRLLGRGGRQVPSGDATDLDAPDLTAATPDAALLRDERRAAVWTAIATLPGHCQRLLRFLMVDPEPSYSEITAALGMPQGSIGPTRRRCLDHLRRRLSGISDDEAGL